MNAWGAIFMERNLANRSTFKPCSLMLLLGRWVLALPVGEIGLIILFALFLITY